MSLFGSEKTAHELALDKVQGIFAKITDTLKELEDASKECEANVTADNELVRQAKERIVHQQAAATKCDTLRNNLSKMMTEKL
jgi:hypothetical protein